MSNNLEEHWRDMPEYKQEDLRSYRRVIVHFRNQEDVDKFAKLMEQKIHPKAKSYWFPYMPPKMASHYRWVDEVKDES